MPPLLVELVGLEIPRRPPPDTRALVERQLGAKRRRDLERDVRLDRKDVVEVAVVRFGPDVFVGARIDELRHDAHAVLRAANASLDEHPHAERHSDLPQALLALLERHGRRARGDAEVPDLREVRDHVLGDAVGEELVFGVGAHVHEWEHGDRGRTGSRRVGRRGVTTCSGGGVLKPREVEHEVLRRRVPALGALREAPLDDPAERDRCPGRGPLERLRFFPNHRRHRLGRARPREGPPSAQHFVHDRAKCELVRPEVHRLAERLFGGHVRKRPQYDAGFRALRGRRRLGGVPRRPGLRPLRETEVEKLQAPVRRHPHVRGLQVAMDDPLLVRRRQRLGDLPGERKRFFD